MKPKVTYFFPSHMDLVDIRLWFGERNIEFPGYEAFHPKPGANVFEPPFAWRCTMYWIDDERKSK